MLPRQGIIGTLTNCGIKPESYKIFDDCSVEFLEDVELRGPEMRKDVHLNGNRLPFIIKKSKGLNLRRIGLISMYGLPQEVDGDLDIAYNRISIFMSVKSITGTLNASYNKFAHIYDIPNIGKSVDLSGNEIGNIDNIQKEIDGDLDISSNKIRALPAGLSVKGFFNGSNNFLINEPVIKDATMVLFENNPCNPADDFDKNLW